MRLLPAMHDRYIGRTVLVSTLVVWAVLLGLDVTLSFVGELEDVGEGSYGALDAVAYMALTVPRRAYQMFPTAGVIGALMGLGQLAATSELTALRAVGLSRRRITIAVAGALALVTMLMVVNGETLGPWGQRRADALKASSKSQNMIVAQFSEGVWAREGDAILHAKGGQERDTGTERWIELSEVQLFEFAEDGRLKSLAKARTAEHRGDHWLLNDVNRMTFSERSVAKTVVKQERWASRLDATALSAGTDKPRYLAADDLRGAIQYRQRNALEAEEFEEIYWGRWFYPLNALALVLAAVPFAFGTLRSGGLGKRLFIGVVFALGFWLVQTQAVELAKVYDLDFRIAYAVPTLVMVLVSWLLFRRRSG